MGISLNGLTPAGTYPGLIKTGDNTAISGTPKVLSDGNGNNLPMEVSTTGVNLTGSPTVNSVAIANTTQVAAKQDTLVSGTNIKTINGASLLGSGNIPVVTSPSGVSGAIQFSDGSAFASDAANLFWDDTNNRLGVGTNAPTQTLDVNGVSNFRDTIGVGVSGRGGTVTWGGGFFMLNSSGTDGASLAINNTKIVNVFPLSLNTMINTTTDLGAKLGIRGSGSTSATTSLLVQNSAGAERIRVFDSNLVRINGGVGNITNGLDVAGGLEIGSSAYLRGLNFMASGLTIGDNAVNFASAILEVKSTTQGFLPPRMTTTQINAIASPANGLEVYNTTLACPCFYDGTAWRKVSHTTM
jgi:hypothetical protein